MDHIQWQRLHSVRNAACLGVFNLVDPLIVALGEVVAHRRGAMALSLRAFGERCLVSANTIRHVEGGMYNCRIDIIVRIARGFGVPAWWLLREADLIQHQRKRARFVE